MAQSSLFGTNKDIFENSDENLTVGRRSPTINLIKIKTSIGRVAVLRKVAKGRPAWNSHQFYLFNLFATKVRTVLCLPARGKHYAIMR